LSIVFLLATGCGRIHYLRPEKSFTENDSDAIVVLRVVPNAYIEIQHGYVNGDGWFTYGTMEPPQFWTEGGFLVAKLRPTKPGEAYALIKIRPDGTWPGYFAEEDSRIPVFSAIAGQINYAGAIDLRWGKSDDQPDTDGPDDAEDADDTNYARSGTDSLTLSVCSCESENDRCSLHGEALSPGTRKRHRQSSSYGADPRQRPPLDPDADYYSPSPDLIATGHA